MPAVEVVGLVKRYGDRVAVDGLSFSVEPGQVFGLLGPNGAGKTTTVECLQGLRRPTAGQLRVLGLDPVADRERLCGRVGSQLQDSALPDRMRVGEALALFAGLGGHRHDWRALLEEWGLAGHTKTSFAHLSGGLRQRLLVALALVSAPEVVFLDELTQGLDPAARRATWELIRAIRDRGTTVVLVTHFMDEAEQLCDRLAVVRAGRVVAEGTPGELVAHHCGPRRVRFSLGATESSLVGALTFLEELPGVREVHALGGEVEVVGHGPVLAHVGAALVARGVAPDDLRLEQPSLEDAFLGLTLEEPSRTTSGPSAEDRRRN